MYEFDSFLSPPRLLRRFERPRATLPRGRRKLRDYKTVVLRDPRCGMRPPLGRRRRRGTRQPAGGTLVPATVVCGGTTTEGQT